MVVAERDRGDLDPAVRLLALGLDARMARAWRERQSELPLSSNSVHVIAENSGHYIQWEASRVVAAVREVVTAALTLALLR